MGLFKKRKVQAGYTREKPTHVKAPPKKEVEVRDFYIEGLSKEEIIGLIKTSRILQTTCWNNTGGPAYKHYETFYQIDYRYIRDLVNMMVEEDE